MIDLYGVLQEQEVINGNIGLGVDYYKGETGAQGIPGKDGKTPIKGVDYYTDEEIDAIKDEIAKEVTVGAKGEDGKSVYQIAVDEGFEGSEADWLASLKGADGRNGIDGINGTNGKDGTNGVDGKTPVKGVDYFTQEEIQQIEDNAADKVDTAGFAKSADLSTVATSGSYTDLTNKPNIPDAYELPVASATTLGGVKVGSGLDITNGVLSATGGGVADAVDWSKVQNKPEFADVATSGDYNDLSNKPTIPSVEGLASESYVNEKVAAIVIPEVPTKVSELENDKGYLTEHQSLEGYAKTADLAQVAKTGSYNDLADKPTIPSTAGLASTKYVDDKVAGIVIPEVPTKVSAFENDKNYATRTELKGYIGAEQIIVNAENNVSQIIGKDIAAKYDEDNNEITTTYAKKTEIQTVPTNVSAFTNDAGYLTEHQSLADYALKSEIPSTTNLATKAEVQEVENKIPAPYTLPTASTSTLGGVKVDGSTITIANGVISAKGSSGGSEPDAYIKDASVSGNTLTLTKKDDTEVVFTPSGGSSSGVSGYAFTSSQTFTDEDKLHLKEKYQNNNIYMTIDRLTVVRMLAIGSTVAYVTINANGVSSNQVLIYSVNIDENKNVISSTFSLLMSYYLVGNNSATTGDVITSDNYNNYIAFPYIAEWVHTTDTSNSDLYNAKELVILYTINSSSQLNYNYFNVSMDQNGNYGATLGTGSLTNQLINMDTSESIYWWYDGNGIYTNGGMNILGILYKT